MAVFALKNYVLINILTMRPFPGPALKLWPATENTLPFSKNGTLLHHRQYGSILFLGVFICPRRKLSSTGSISRKKLEDEVRHAGWIQARDRWAKHIF